MVTGGGSGIGKATAKSVICTDGKVIIVGRNEQRLQRVCDNEDNIKYIKQDVNEIDDYHSFFNKCENCFKSKITGIVNNAGIYIDKQPLDFTKEDDKRILESDLIAPMMLIQKYIEYCLNNNIYGNVVCTSSNRSFFGGFGILCG